MDIRKRIRKIVDEYNSKCFIDIDKIEFEESSDNCNLHFHKGFQTILVIISDLNVYAGNVKELMKDDYTKRILEILEEERMKRSELRYGVEKAVGWINGELLNYKGVLNFFRVNVNMVRISIFHEDDELMSINLENLEIVAENVTVDGFDNYINRLYFILRNIVKGYNVFFTEERDDDDEYSLYNLFILDVEKFKRSKYVVFEDNSSLVEKDIVGAYNELYISDKYELGFSNRLYVEKYYADNFEECIELINKEDESIEKKVTDILLDDSYNRVFKDIKVYDKDSMIEIDTRSVKFIYSKEDKKLMVNRVEDFEFDELRDLSEDMEAIEDEIDKIL